MVSQGYFEHTSPAGVTFIDRIAATGYTQGARSWVVGENLVWGTGPLSTPASHWSPSWMNSPPHRENLLRARFREIGIAAVAGTPVTSSGPDRGHGLERVRLPRSQGQAEEAGQARRRTGTGAGTRTSPAPGRAM